MVTEPQNEVFCVVDGNGELGTTSASNRWAFKTRYHALLRRNSDRENGGARSWSGARVARYEFAGWVD